MNTDGKRRLSPEGDNQHDGSMQPHQPNYNALNSSSPTALQSSSVVAKNNSDEGGLDLGRIGKTFQRQIWIIMLSNIIMAGAAIAWNRTRPPAYEGSFKILIEPATAEGQVVSSLKGNQTSTEEQDLSSANSKVTLDYPTQIQILLSDKTLLPVVQQLQTYYPETSYQNLRGALTVSRFKEQSETKILEVKYVSRTSNETKQVMNLVSRAYIQYSLTERQTNVRRAMQFVDSQLPTIQSQVRELELALQTFREKNQLIDPVTLGSQLGSQNGNVQQELITTQIELAKTRQLYNSLEKQLQLQPNDAEAASVLSEAPGYQQLVKQLQDIDVELETQSAQLTDENPKIILLREKRARLLPLLQQKAGPTLGNNLAQKTNNVQALPYQNGLRQDLSKQFIGAATQVQVLEAKLNGLNLANQNLAVQTGQLPIISRQYENLQRRLKTATEQLSKFLQKREELMINAARQEIPWELIAPPTVKTISSSGLFKDLLLGLSIGSLLGAGIAILLEKMNDVIYSVKDLKDELNLSVLGMIPDINEEKILNSQKGRKEKLATNHNYQFSPFTESFRALNSQIRLLRPDSPIKSLVISSALPDEGKTTVALHLARAAAAMGQRVLLVNADMRKASPNTEGSNFITGLTDVIAGTTHLMDAIKLLPGENSLYILPAGSTIMDPTSLLGSNKMHNLMEICKRSFDLVIYDTVPLSFADSLLIIPQTDGLLMVARLSKIHREDLRHSLNILDVSRVKVLGLVVNMASTVGSPKNRPHASTVQSQGALLLPAQLDSIIKQ
jgi:polysaccharide biosynthesis transport protein